MGGELRLSGNHTLTEYEMSGELYSQKGEWIIHSNEGIFQVMIFKINIRSVVLPVMANIAQVIWSGESRGSSGGSPHLIHY